MIGESFEMHVLFYNLQRFAASMCLYLRVVLSVDAVHANDLYPLRAFVRFFDWENVEVGTPRSNIFLALCCRRARAIQTAAQSMGQSTCSCLKVLVSDPSVYKMISVTGNNLDNHSPVD